MGVIFTVPEFEFEKSPFWSKSLEYFYCCEATHNQEFRLVTAAVGALMMQTDEQLDSARGTLLGYDKGLSEQTFMGVFTYLSLAIRGAVPEQRDDDSIREVKPHLPLMFSDINDYSVGFLEYGLLQLNHIGRLQFDGYRAKERVQLYTIYIAVALAQVAEEMIRYEDPAYELIPDRKKGIAGMLDRVTVGTQYIINTKRRREANTPAQGLEEGGVEMFNAKRLGLTAARAALAMNYLENRAKLVPTLSIPKDNEKNPRTVEDLKVIATALLDLITRSAFAFTLSMKKAVGINLHLKKPSEMLLYECSQANFISVTRALMSILVPNARATDGMIQNPQNMDVRAVAACDPASIRQRTPLSEVFMFFNLSRQEKKLDLRTTRAKIRCMEARLHKYKDKFFARLGNGHDDIEDMFNESTCEDMFTALEDYLAL